MNALRESGTGWCFDSRWAVAARWLPARLSEVSITMTFALENAYQFFLRLENILAWSRLLCHLHLLVLHTTLNPLA